MTLPWFLLAYVAGLGAAPFFGPGSGLLPGALVLAGGWFPLRHRSLSRPLLWGLFFLCGWAQYHLHLTPPKESDHISAFAGDTPVIVDGTILEVHSRPEKGASFDIDSRTLSSDGIAAPVHGRLRLYLQQGDPDLASGDRIRFRGTLKRPRLFGTPGEFDFPRYLASREIFVTAALDDPSALVLLDRPPPSGVPALIARFRDRIRRTIVAGVTDPPLASLVRALVIGDKGGVTADDRDLLARGGVSHLFAISGLHLGLIALFLYTVLRTLYCRSTTLLSFLPPGRLLPPLLLPLLYGYLLLTGNALPTRRAFLVALFTAGLLLWRRDTPPLKLLVAAAFSILLFEPLALFEPAFELSFAGVLGILVLVPRWSRRLDSLPRRGRWAAGILLSTCAATLTTTPLVLLHFHLFAPAGIVANLAAIPLIGFAAVPLALGGILFTPLWPTAAQTLFHGCASIIEWVLSLLRHLVALPSLGGWQIYLSPWDTAALLALTLALLLGGGSPRQGVRGGLLAAAVLFSLVLPAFQSQELTVTALSVGQGESLLVSCAGKEHYLIDGGGLYSETFDVGERLLAPALGHLGVRSLAGVILTHDHPDHRQGLLYILEHFPVATFWTATPAVDLDRTLQQVLADRNIPVVLVPPGWHGVKETPEGEMALFAPRADHASANDRSLVTYLRQGDAGTLLTGDLEEEGVRELLANLAEKPVSLLKIPHHGSRKSAPDLLLDRCRPQRVFASLGTGNRYGFPHPDIVNGIEGRGLRLDRTDLDGTLRFVAREGTWSMSHWSSGVFR